MLQLAQLLFIIALLIAFVFITLGIGYFLIEVGWLKNQNQRQCPAGSLSRLWPHRRVCDIARNAGFISGVKPCLI